MFQIIYIISAIKNKIKNFKYIDSNFKTFIIQILCLIYLLDYLDNIIKKNIHHRCKAVVLQTISEIGLFLGSRLY